jgi:hypothetical protein
MECRNSLNVDFNKQLEILVPKPGKGAIKSRKQAFFNKTDVFPPRHLCHQ